MAISMMIFVNLNTSGMKTCDICTNFSMISFRTYPLAAYFRVAPSQFSVSYLSLRTMALRV